LKWFDEMGKLDFLEVFNEKIISGIIDGIERTVSIDVDQAVNLIKSSIEKEVEKQNVY